MIKPFRHICTIEGYFDHYRFFTTFFNNYKEAYELTEKILNANFGVSRYSTYESFKNRKGDAMKKGDRLNNAKYLKVIDCE